MKTKNPKKEFIILLVTSLIMIFLMFFTLFKINVFMDSYENCKDDFKVIEVCGCLPYEGNYEYFYDSVQLNNTFAIRKQFFDEVLNNESFKYE